MKTIHSLIAMVMVLAFTACSKSENTTDSTLSLESAKIEYGIEAATSYPKNIGVIPSITLAEAQNFLEELNRNSNTNQQCITEQSKVNYNDGSEEIVRKIIMVNSYQVATTKGGTENFQLRVELKFNITPSQVFYTGKSFEYKSDLFNWYANDLSIAPVKGATTINYTFGSESAIYFKIKDEGDCLVKVPIKFEANYDFTVGKGTYNFQLLKISK